MMRNGWRTVSAGHTAIAVAADIAAHVTGGDPLRCAGRRDSDDVVKEVNRDSQWCERNGVREH